MVTDIRTQVLQRIQDLAQSGESEKALGCVQEYLLANPADGKAMNDAGALLYAMGCLDEAIEYLEKARKINGNCPQILWNLSEVYLAADKAEEASQLFDLMEQQRILNPDIINRTATKFLDQNEKGKALEMLLRSLRISPNQEVLRPMVEIIRSKRPKIAFFCGADGPKFLTEIYQFAKERFPVEIFNGSDSLQMYELMKWSDISWFEWCTEYAVEASKLPKVCSTVVRFHRWEAYGDYVKQVNWNNIDVLITVGNSFVYDMLLRQVPDIQSSTSIITVPSGIDLEEFPFAQRERGKNLACVGNIIPGKNPMLLVQCMQKLHYIDPEYRLFFAGEFKDPALEQYIRQMVKSLDLSNTIFFDGWQDNVSKWLEDKHYIVSASIIESQGMGLLEGMARGLKPVIHNFPGANEIFPSECLFNISEEFCRQVTSDAYDPQHYRDFVVARYQLKKQLDSINRIFADFENTPFRKNEFFPINTQYACAQ